MAVAAGEISNNLDRHFAPGGAYYDKLIPQDGPEGVADMVIPGPLRGRFDQVAQTLRADERLAGLPDRFAAAAVLYEDGRNLSDERLVNLTLCLTGLNQAFTKSAGRPILGVRRDEMQAGILAQDTGVYFKSHITHVLNGVSMLIPCEPPVIKAEITGLPVAAEVAPHDLLTEPDARSASFEWPVNESSTGEDQSTVLTTNAELAAQRILDKSGILVVGDRSIDVFTDALIYQFPKTPQDELRQGIGVQVDMLLVAKGIIES